MPPSSASPFSPLQGEGIAYAIGVDYALAIAEQLSQGNSLRWTCLHVAVRGRPDGSPPWSWLIARPTWMAAYAASRSQTAVGAYYRSMRARKGPQQAIVATAHKIAHIVYHLLKTGEAYVEQTAGDFEQHW